MIVHIQIWHWRAHTKGHASLPNQGTQETKKVNGTGKNLDL